MKRRPKITAEDRLRQIAADPSLRRTAWESAQSELARIKLERGQPHAERLAALSSVSGPDTSVLSRTARDVGKPARQVGQLCGEGRA